MASLYIYKNKELKSFVQQPWLIDELLYDYKIQTFTTEFKDIDNYVKEATETFNFVDYDIFTIRIPIVEVDPHQHKTPEGRMILKGNGRFYFEFSDTLIELHVFPGDFVFIPAEIKHYFKCLEAMVVMRFFSSLDAEKFTE